MPQFTAEVSEHRVRSKQLEQTGTLKFSTQIDVGHDYRLAPTKVQISYQASFCPDPQFWEHADNDPAERYPHYYDKSFDRPDERASYCQTFYEFLDHAPP